ncbi:hypothetical protein BDZ91DRAFT_793116 [Kalaharituber pfeilii]|nr:hypothetical protein BDZ91DRAFT_793116 [Kalaharituber pfeilii]
MAPLKSFILLSIAIPFTLLASAAPLPQGGNAGHFANHSNLGRGPSEIHGIGYAGQYDINGEYGVSTDPDLRNFNHIVYGPPDGSAPPVGWPNTPPGPALTPEEKAISDYIPSHIASSPAVRGFDEDLTVLDSPQPQPQLLGPGDAPVSPFPRSSHSTTASQIPATEIANEFPEYEHPKTFSTERVDYTIRTNNNPINYGEGQPAGEDSSNVAVFNDDKAYHWSGSTSAALPKNDPHFREAMGFITGKFKGDRKNSDGGARARGKSRAHKTSIFDVLGDVY